MSKQRGIAFLHVILLFIVIVLGSIAVSHYMKVSAKKAEESARQQAIVDSEKKRLEAMEQKKALAIKGLEELKAMDKILQDDWVPASKVALATSRISLAGPVQSMQAIYKKVKELPASNCAIPGKEGLTEYMQQIIDGFLAFMASSSSSGYGQDSIRAIEKYRYAMKTCRLLALGEEPSTDQATLETSPSLGALISDGTPSAPEALAKGKNCFSCHHTDRKIVGPAFKDVAKRYAGQPEANTKLVDKVVAGGKGAWGEIPMPPNNVNRGEASTLVTWILELPHN